jgi:HEAT repeat protein
MEDEAEDVRSASIFALKEAGLGQFAVRRLILWLENEKRRVEAVWRLSIFPEAAHESVPHLIGSLQDRDSVTRASAAETLGGLGRSATEAIFALEDARRDESP